MTRLPAATFLEHMRRMDHARRPVAAPGAPLPRAPSLPQSLPTDSDVGLLTARLDVLSVSNALRSLDASTTHGADGVPVQLLQQCVLRVPMPDGTTELVNVLVDRITRLLNVVVATATVPQQWVRSLVSFIPKPGRDHSCPKGYRPISVTPVLYRLLMKLLQARIQRFVDDSGALSEAQLGFRPGMGCEHALFVLHALKDVSA